MTVGKVITEASTSMDGYIAQQDNTIGQLSDWLQNGRSRSAPRPETSRLT